ncbi:alpha/beta hydrolase [Paenibacillus sp. JX-17]|uniref:Alpha/beta hydrolase n=1 Tax=Paenibacillus lacisoli TaxID=3064525 RepID=A0ABT9CJI5_9BACL|nr:alpha/beta hydrolase [Paenibacillus sp. JX-17]MDO7907826.1 alpha/beta hydrolase [Paenibacillus sp. JX-17]
MEKILCDGQHLCYVDQGKGDVVVLLHGFCGSSAYWEEVVPYLSKHYRCIVPDLRGHGLSDAPMGAYTIEQMADDVISLLNELKIEKATVLGHSLGGYITLSIAQRHAHRLERFGLIHSTAHDDTEEGKEKRLKAVSTIQSQGITDFIDGMTPGLFAPEHVETHPEWLARISEIGYRTPPQGAVGTALAMRERPDRRDVLSATTLPVLLVAGEKDQIVPAERTFTVDKKNVTQAVISDAGHMSLIEAPQKLAEIIVQFIGAASTAVK